MLTRNVPLLVIFIILKMSYDPGLNPGDKGKISTIIIKTQYVIGKKCV